MKRTAIVVAVLLAAAVCARAAANKIYDENANASQLIAAAIQRASASHKNIVLDFGANWCPDCHALDAAMHRGELARVIAKNFEIVHISVGRFDRNLDVARKYQIPLHKGIPALAVLDPHGKLLYSQKEGQFEDARAMDAGSFLEFFKKWGPARE